MIYLDTNALVRFFLNEDKEKVLLVKSLLDTETEVHIIDAVLPEIEYVLRSVYKQPRQAVIESFQFLSAQSSIVLSPVARQSIRLFEKTTFDMVDCMIAVSSYDGKLASFDKKLLKTPGVVRYW